MKCVQTSTKWYCMQCRDFLPIQQFKTGPKRWICRRHYNEKWHKVKMEQWIKNPQQKQSNIMWQIAYKDSVTVFLLKIEITPAQVLILLQDHTIPINTDVRLLPLNPKKPLTLDNYCLTSLAIRKVMCRVWKRFCCTSEYEGALGHYGVIQTISSRWQWHLVKFCYVPMWDKDTSYWKRLFNHYASECSCCVIDFAVMECITMCVLLLSSYCRCFYCGLAIVVLWFCRSCTVVLP